MYTDDAVVLDDTKREVLLHFCCVQDNAYMHLQAYHFAHDDSYALCVATIVTLRGTRLYSAHDSFGLTRDEFITALDTMLCD